ncbi:MAG: O-antigen ligase family protein [Campylobacterota bacterium]|nr:O-antigen ligase family protein [Campylobacterota bacterium]
MSKLNYSNTYYILVASFALFLPLSRALTSLIAVVLLLVWLIEGDFARKLKQIVSNNFFIILISYVLLMSISILWTEDLTTGFSKIQKLCYFLLIFIISTSLKQIYTNKVINFFLLGMFVSEIIAYGAFFELWTFKNATAEYLSPIMHHTHYSIFMAVTSIILLNRLFLCNYNLKEKIFFLLFFLTVTGNLFLAPGRTGQVALIAGIIIMTLIHFRLTIKSMLISILLISSIYLTAYSISDTFKNRISVGLSDIKKLEKLDFSSSLGIRVAYWLTSYDSMMENPFGYGIGDYQIAINDQLDRKKYNMIKGYAREFMLTHQPHSQYLLTLLQIGFLGLSLLFILIIYMFKIKIIDIEMKKLSILFTVIFFVSCIPESLFNFHYSLFLYILFTSLFSIYTIQESGKNT